MTNKTLLQGFEWYLPDDGLHWRRLAVQAPLLKKAGIDSIWLPPAYKGNGGKNSVGYDVYDKYDLGEFDQKGSVPTKYGTKDEYLHCIEVCREAGLEVICDIVVNHMMGADETETIRVVEDSFDDRNQQISNQKEIEAWTRFTFPGRHGAYSKDIWTFKNFNGMDWDESDHTNGLFRIVGKDWNQETDWENGNFDYLMGVNLEMSNHDTARKITDWGKWYMDMTEADGLRLDAVKHISHDFIPAWLKELKEYKNRDFFVVGEYWSDEIERLLHYLDAIGNQFSLFDSPLHYALHYASTSNGEFDMSTLMNTSLLKARPENAVTFVDNHDTQPGQALESFIAPWFKQQAYAAILFQEAGIPCVFYGDLYGIPHDHIPPVTGLVKMCQARKLCAYGTQKDYFDAPDIVGYTRAGDDFEEETLSAKSGLGSDQTRHEGSGMAILMTNSAGGSKRMYVSMRYAGERFVNILKPTDTPVEIGSDGCGDFTVDDGSASVWIRESAYEVLETTVLD